MHEIELWIRDGKNWQKGLMLYSKYGRFKSVLATLHAMGQNHITEKTLENHLRSELAYITAEEANRAANAQAITQTQPETAPMAHIAPLQEEANKVYAEMGGITFFILVLLRRTFFLDT